jgi:hypothetical protein
LHLVHDQKAAASIGTKLTQHIRKAQQKGRFGCVLGLDAKAGQGEAEQVVLRHLRGADPGDDGAAPIELGEDPLDQGGFAGPHFPGDDDEAFALRETEGEMREGAAMLVAAIEETGIRGKLKGGASEAIVFFKHGIRFETKPACEARVPASEGFQQPDGNETDVLRCLADIVDLSAIAVGVANVDIQLIA